MARIRRGQARKQILDAAIKLFAERGYEGTSIKDVADLVGCNQATVYKNFPTKDELYRALFNERYVDSDSFRSLTKALKQPNVFKALWDAIRVWQEGFLERPYMLRFQLFMALEKPLFMREAQVRIIPIYDALSSRLEAAREAGEIRKDVSPYLAARTLVSIVYHRFLLLEILQGKYIPELKPDIPLSDFFTSWMSGIVTNPEQVVEFIKIL